MAQWPSHFFFSLITPGPLISPSMPCQVFSLQFSVSQDSLAQSSLHYVPGSFPHPLHLFPKALGRKLNTEHHRHCTCPSLYRSSSISSTAPPNYFTHLFWSLHIALPPQIKYKLHHGKRFCWNKFEEILFLLVTHYINKSYFLKKNPFIPG